MIPTDFAFNRRRFTALMRLQWAEQPLWPYFLAPFLTLLISWMMLVRPDQLNGMGVGILEENVYNAFYVSVLLSCCAYAGHVFWEWGHPARLRQFLCLPAGLLEKWMAKLSLAFVVFPLYATLIVGLCIEGIRLYVLKTYAFRLEPFAPAAMLQKIASIYFMLLLTFVVGQYIGRFGFLITFIGFVFLQVATMALSTYWYQFTVGSVGSAAAILQTICYGISLLLYPGFILGSLLALREKEA